MGAKWSNEEDDRIVALWETDKPTKSALPEFPGRTVEAIRKRASVLGLPDKRTAPSVFPNKARDYLQTGCHATALEISIEMRACEQRVRDALRTMVKNGEVHIVSYDGPHRAAIYAYGPGENAPKPEKLSQKEAQLRWAKKKAPRQLSEAEREKALDEAYRDTKCRWWPKLDHGLDQIFAAFARNDIGVAA
jgi:hypothetical protein